MTNTRAPVVRVRPEHPLELPMSHPVPDPTHWLVDLMKSEDAVLWSTGPIADTSKTIAAAAAPWTKAVADFTSWQLTSMQQMATPWISALPGADATAEPVKDKRFAGE